MTRNFNARSFLIKTRMNREGSEPTTLMTAIVSTSSVIQTRDIFSQVKVDLLHICLILCGRFTVGFRRLWLHYLILLYLVKKIIK